MHWSYKTTLMKLTHDYPAVMNLIPTSHAYLKIDKSQPTEEGTVFNTSINNTEMNTLFDTA